MAARHKGSHKPRHHTQAKKSDRIVILEPLPTTAADATTAASPSHAETAQVTAGDTASSSTATDA